MLKRSVLALSLASLAVAGLSCGDPAGLPTTGSISLVLVSEGGNVLSIVAPNGNVLADLVPGPSQLSNVTLTSVRVTVAGATNKTVTNATPSGGFFDITVDGLSAGTYSVTVEGLVNNEVAHFGQTSGVAVTAGATSQATVTFPSFEPVVGPSTVPDTTDVLHFTVTYGAVTNATGYIVQWSKSPSMANASSKSVTGGSTTSTDVTITEEGNFYVTVKAVNAVVPSGGKSSSVQVVYAFQGVATVTVTPATPTVAFGGTQTLAAEARDADNAIVPSVPWFWSSDRPSVATVSQLGVVTGVSFGTATITALGKGTPGSTTVSVGAQLATQLAFTIQPTDAVAGDPFSPAVQVEIRDASGNRVSTSRDEVTIAIGTNPASGTLTGTKKVNAINGIASFTGLWVNKAAAGYTLAATSGAWTQATSSPFTIAAGPSARLRFVAQPANVAANVAIAPAVTVTVTDQFDNPVTTATDQITISLANSPWKSAISNGGNVGGVTTATAVAGVATFNNVRLDKPGTGFTLGASSGALVGGTSSPFNVTLSLLQLASGNSHTCGIGAGGTGTFCWGDNESGQLGALTGFTGTDSIASLVRGGLTFTSVVAGGNHSCGLTAAGAAHCWGSNESGQLGNNTLQSSDVPVLVTGAHVFNVIVAGGNHTCGITTGSGVPAENQQVYCWGWNQYGQLGNNAAGTDSPFPVRVNEPLQATALAFQISAGYYNTCVVAVVQPGPAPRNAYCWGYNGYGTVGDGTNTQRNEPTLVIGGLQWNSVSVGLYGHACGLLTDNSARCWGNGGSGQLGNASNNDSSTPVALSGAPIVWSSISAGGSHTCGLSSANAAFCWGYNYYGQLGDGTSNDANVRRTVSGGLTFTANTVKSGAYHSCGRTAAGVFCWGANFSGQLGNAGNGNSRNTPTQIAQ